MRTPSLLTFFLAAAAVAAAQNHLHYVRPVTLSDPGKQAYIVMDEALLTRLKPDMGDMRLFSASGREVQYLIREQRAARYSNWQAARLLNRGSVGADTRFSIETDVPEYDRIQLSVATENFVARAGVEGADDAAAKDWNNLGTFSLYDFTRERLGSSDTLRLKSPVRYRYLRITISGGVPADDIRGANIANFQEDKARYVALSAQPHTAQQGNRTIVTWNTSEKIPVEKIVVDVDPAEVNFSRDTALFCDERRTSSYELSRVRLNRKGRLIESESLGIEPYGMRCKSYKLDILNGDNPPLRISAVRPLMLERRIYFDPKGETSFKLYTGDTKTTAPLYDYARFFEPADADKMARADMQAEIANPDFTEWPDDRPFTERHKSLLFVVMVLAVGLLGAWALKGFKA